MATQELSNEIFNIKEKLTQEEYKNLYDSLSKVNKEMNKHKLVELTYMSIEPVLVSQAPQGEQDIRINTDVKTIVVPISCVHSCIGTLDIDKLKKRIGSGFKIGRNIENNYDRDVEDTRSISLGVMIGKSFLVHIAGCNGLDCETEENGYDVDSGCLCSTTNIKYSKNVLIGVEEFVVIG